MMTVLQGVQQGFDGTKELLQSTNGDSRLDQQWIVHWIVLLVTVPSRTLGGVALMGLDRTAANAQVEELFAVS